MLQPHYPSLQSGVNNATFRLRLQPALNESQTEKRKRNQIDMRSASRPSSINTTLSPFSVFLPEFFSPTRSNSSSMPLQAHNQGRTPLPAGIPAGSGTKNAMELIVLLKTHEKTPSVFPQAPFCSDLIPTARAQQPPTRHRFLPRCHSRYQFELPHWWGVQCTGCKSSIPSFYRFHQTILASHKRTS